MSPLCPTHLILFLSNISVLGREVAIIYSPLCNFLRSLTLSLLGPNVILSLPFPDMLSLCSSFKVEDKFLDQYKTNDKYCRLNFNANYSITEHIEIKVCTCSESETEEEIYKIEM